MSANPNHENPPPSDSPTILIDTSSHSNGSSRSGSANTPPGHLPSSGSGSFEMTHVVNLTKSSSSTTSLGGMSRAKSIEMLHLGYEQQLPTSMFQHLKHNHQRFHEPQAHYNHSEWVQSLQPLLDNYFKAELHTIKDHETHLTNTVRKIVKKITQKSEKAESFFVVDLSHIIRQVERWRNSMTLYPNMSHSSEGTNESIDDMGITPFYAVKCNPNENIIKILYMMGSGFDCASEQEISIVCRLCREVDSWLEQNPQNYEYLKTVNPHLTLEQIKSRRFVPSRDIIFAQPCKQIAHMRAASEAGVRWTTLDSVSEVEKLAEYWKEAKGVVRIKTDDSHSSVGFSTKFGCSRFGALQVLKRAKELGVNLVGVSFHVGTACTDVQSYMKALHDAHELCKAAHEQYGFDKFNLIDIGGGMLGRVKAELPLEDIASNITPLIRELFPREDANASSVVGNNIRVIAEPGRYIVSASHTLVVNVHTKKDLRDENLANELYLKEKGIEVETMTPPDDFIYYLNDGIYGSFNNIVFDHAHPIVNTIISKKTKHEQKYLSTVFGPTCDSLDIILRGYPLPELHVGDWLFFNEFGAYTTASSTDFNGFKTNRLHYIWRN